MAPVADRNCSKLADRRRSTEREADQPYRPRPERVSHTLANLPPLPPAGRAPQGGHNAAAGKANPKDARAGSKGSGNLKQGGMSKVAQSSRKQGDR